MAEMPKSPEIEKKALGQKTALNKFTANAEAFIKYYQLIAIILVIILTVAAGTGLFAIYRSNIESLNFEKDRAIKVLADKKIEMDKLKNIKIGYDTIAQSEQKILDILPLEKDLPSILIQLETLAAGNNLSMNSLNVADPVAAGDEEAAKVKQVVLTISLIGGNYFDLKNYLNDLEKNMRLMDVRAIVYSPVSKSYNLTVTAYYAED
jgi:Tfp pilus assembly protein PilO